MEMARICALTHSNLCVFVVSWYQILNIYKRQPNSRQKPWAPFESNLSAFQRDCFISARSYSVCCVCCMCQLFLTSFSFGDRWWKSNRAIEYFKSTKKHKHFLFIFQNRNEWQITLRMTTKWIKKGNKWWKNTETASSIGLVAKPSVHLFALISS